MCRKKVVDSKERLTSPNTGLRNCNDCGKCSKCQHSKGEVKSISGTKSTSSSSSSSPSTKSKRSSASTHHSASKKKESKEKVCKQGSAPEGKKLDQKETAHTINWFPDHIEKDPAKHPLIPFPHPPPNVELRAGRLMAMCLCLKRNGLQSDCPQTGCQGREECMQNFLPACIPSGLALPEPKVPYLQKADDPECYSKAELVKAYDKVMLETQTGGTGGIEGPEEDSDKRHKTRGKKVESVPPVETKSKHSILSDVSKLETDSMKKVVHIRPNSPPNYISEPPLRIYHAPCRRHASKGIPGSGKYNKYERCRLKGGKTLPKIIVPRKQK